METWPIRLLTPRNVGWNIAWQNITTSASLGGFNQVVNPGVNPWIATFEDVVLRTREQLDAWEKLALMVEGRASPLLVPVIIGKNAPWPVDPVTGKQLSPDSTRHDELDDTIYEEGPYGTASIVAQAASATVAGDTSIDILITTGTAAKELHFFSDGNFRLYRIRSVTSEVESSSGWESNGCDVRPPMRNAIALGASLSFMNPRCKMRLLSDDALHLTKEDLRFGRKSVQFIEDPN